MSDAHKPVGTGDLEEMHYELDMPARSIIAADARLCVGREVRRLGWSRVLLVSDEFHEAAGRVEEMSRLLENARISVSVYSDVNCEPDTKIVESGFSRYQADGCDGVVALGGGSVIDAAKMINVRAHNPGGVKQLMGVNNVTRPCTGIVAIPTTAGTGSEATKVVVIADSENAVKMTGRDRAFVCAVAVLDCKLTLSMPLGLTGAVGIDALTHAIEAFVSKEANTFTDAMALNAAGLISRSIRRAVENGDDEDARRDMLTGSFLAGIAFSNASVGLVHSMSEPLGACFHIPHGLSNAMLLPAVTRFSIEGASDRHAALARCMNLADESASDERCCQMLVEELHGLNRDLNIPTPASYGIDKSHYQDAIEKMSLDASRAGSTANSPVVPTVEQIAGIYRSV